MFPYIKKWQKNTLAYLVPVYASEERMRLDVCESGLNLASQPLFWVLNRTHTLLITHLTKAQIWCREFQNMELIQFMYSYFRRMEFNTFTLAYVADVILCPER